MVIGVNRYIAVLAKFSFFKINWLMHVELLCKNGLCVLYRAYVRGRIKYPKCL